MEVHVCHRRRQFSNHYILYFRDNHHAGDLLYNDGPCVMMIMIIIIIIIIITVIRQTAIIPVHNVPVSAKPLYVYTYIIIYIICIHIHMYIHI